MPAEPRQIESAGGVILHGGRVLVLCKRTNPEWRLPKGTVEPGEEPRAAALREVAEETGFADLEVTGDLGAENVSFRLADGLVERREQYFAMSLRSFVRRTRSPRDSFRFGVVWLPVEQALERLTFDNERAVLRRALERAQQD